MPNNGNHFSDSKMGSAITVRITPRSSKNEITGIMEDGTIKIRLTAPPVDGKANELLIKFLADILDTAPSKIEIIGGLSNRDKLVTIIDINTSQVQEKILSHVAK